jgi:hypothetical protein
MADVPTALLQQLLTFVEGRVQSLLSTTFKDASSLASELRAGAATTDLQTKIQNLVNDLAANALPVQDLATVVQGFAADAQLAANQIGPLLATSPFSLAQAGQVAGKLAVVANDLAAAINAIADYLVNLDPSKPQPDIKDDTLGITSPWSAAFRSLPAGAGSLFDGFASQLLGLAGATTKLTSALSNDRTNQEISAKLVSSGERTPVPAVPTLSLEGISLAAFLDYGAEPSIGIRASAMVNTGLRTDGLLEQIIPATAPKAQSAPITVQVDTASGLSLGTGGSPRLMLQTSFDWPGIELRDVGLAVSNQRGGQLDLTATVAGSLAGVINIVVEGGGVRIGLLSSAAPGTLPITVALLAPDGAGIQVNAGLVTGGGFMQQVNGEYGGTLALRLTEIGITAIGLLSTSPFSLVLVIGLEFFPAIELGLGFTLNGVGGLLALERSVASDALRQTIVDGSADEILFPRDPVAAAPTILATLHNLFPQQAGAFVVGPIAELGWGSQAKLVTAKIGVAISLPDPKVILLGALRIAVPSTELPPDLCIIDLNAGIIGEVTSEYTFLAAGLTNSRVAGVAISGDVALYLSWGSSPDVAITVGGFHPHYSPPPLLTGMRRISLDLSPAVLVTLHAEGYVAVTSNTLQFGAQVRLSADIGIASGEAWLGLDVLFRWAPHLFFEADINAGISIEAFGETFANIGLTGHLQGMTPWMLEGTATVDVWYLPTIHFDVGPFTWGPDSSPEEPQVSPLDIVADALTPDQAWTPRLPSGAETLVRFKEDGAAGLLVHPLGGVEMRQIKVPLEFQIDHIGKSPVTSHRVNLDSPLLGGIAAGAVSHVEELFALADFVDLSDDDRLGRPSFEPKPAGAQMVATAGPLSGAAVDDTYQWETIFPHEPGLDTPPSSQLFIGIASMVLRSGSVARASRARGSAYTTPTDPIRLSPAGTKEIRRGSDLAAVPDVTVRATTADAARTLADMRKQLGASTDLELVSAGIAS